MDELVKTFHIDWKLLIAQLVNFAIVAGVLWYFALKPLMKVMNKRTSDIEQSLKDAKEIEQKLHDAEKTKQAVIIEAQKEAQILMEKSYKDAETMKEEKLRETRQEMEKIAAKTKADLLLEKDKMIQEAKHDVADLVISASSKIIGKHLDAAANKKLIEDTIDQAKK
jgi:F-type H+-transporting ATPase subunit b